VQARLEARVLLLSRVRDGRTQAAQEFRDGRELAVRRAGIAAALPGPGSRHHRRADRRTQNANQNKVVFDVRPTASKPEIKRAIEQVYDVKVVRVNTLHTKRGKRAIIKLSEADNAEDIYTRLGQM